LRGQTLLTGTRAALSRAQQVIEEENNELSAALAKLYLEKTFTLTTKKAVLTILYHIRDVLKFELSHAHWMSKPTQIGALKKLDSLKFNIGYPEQGLNLNYSSLKIDRGLYVKNILRVNKFNAARSLNQIGKPDDQREWFFSPQTANATYSRQRNTLYISAGLLQPPFYAPRALLSVNYGALGSSIGHEMMHAFDYTGALYDSEGNVKNWWTAADLKKFHAALQCFSNQFSQYKGEGGLLVQGEKVRDEAAADLGGLILAYKAFHDLPEYKKLPVIEGFSPTQQFFLAFAHKFAENMTPGSAYRQISNDVHAPTQYRVNGTLANMQQFQQVFVISNDSPMVNQKRCVMW
jgi:putative endopeptidase